MGVINGLQWKRRSSNWALSFKSGWGLNHLCFACGFCQFNTYEQFWRYVAPNCLASESAPMCFFARLES